jgi:hypothetical protein
LKTTVSFIYTCSITILFVIWAKIPLCSVSSG